MLREHSNANLVFLALSQIRNNADLNAIILSTLTGTFMVAETVQPVLILSLKQANAMFAL